MNSYTIDPSVFVAPEIPKDNKLLKEFEKQLDCYFWNISKCYDLLHFEGISVYVFRGYRNNFNDEYVKNATEYLKNATSNLPPDLYKKKLESILLFNMPKLHHGNKIGAKKYYFQDWFGIEKMKYIESGYKPLYKNSKKNSDEIIHRLNHIGILNKYIYKNNFMHNLVINESIKNITLKSKMISFSIWGKENHDEKMSVSIETSNISEVNVKKIEISEKVIDVYQYAKKELYDYIIFGNDVKKGIETIKDYAGPPNRIFAYLKTLKEYCIYKKNNEIIISDQYMLHSLGCVCSYEDDGIFSDERAMDERSFDNGNNEKQLFKLHLKPNTFPEYKDTERRKRTVRIYISWNDLQKKVIVGWIGKHPFTPETNFF